MNVLLIYSHSWVVQPHFGLLFVWLQQCLTGIFWCPERGSGSCRMIWKSWPLDSSTRSGWTWSWGWNRTNSSAGSTSKRWTESGLSLRVTHSENYRSAQHLSAHRTFCTLPAQCRTAESPSTAWTGSGWYWSFWRSCSYSHTFLTTTATTGSWENAAKCCAVFTC